jgi:flagellar hook-basal body complex protein FliE
MTTPISAPQLAGLSWPSELTSATGPKPTGGFAELLEQSLQQMQGLTSNAEQAVERSLTGDDLAMVETFSAVREADLALRLMLQIRNKLVDAYQEVQQMRF